MKEVKLLDFWAPWCGPCKTMMPVIDELAETYSVEKINVDLQPTVADKYVIRSIPTFIITVDGKEVERISGVVSKEHLERLIKEYV